MSTAFDSRRFLYAYLKADPTLVQTITINGKLQLYGPPGIVPTWSTRALEYIRMNAPIHRDLPVEQASYQFRCYGATLQEAQKVYDALEPLIHRRNAVAVVSKGETSHLQFAQITSVNDGYEGEPLSWDYIMVLAEMHWSKVVRS